MTDPILSELWAIKDGLANECAHDRRRLFDTLKKAQESRAGKTVNRTTRRSPQTSG